MRSLFLALTILVILISTRGSAQITWQQTNGPLGVANGNVACMTLEPQYWYLYAGTQGGGILQTLDSGVTWQSINNGLTDLNVQSLLGMYPTTVLAGTHSSGIFRTSDHGATWIQCNSGLNNLNVAALAYDQLNNEFAGTANGLFKSTDLGIHWSSLSSPAVGGITTLAVNPNNDIFMGDSGHVWRTTDHGASWTNVCSWSSPVISVITVSSATSLFVGDANNGIHRSLDNGATWTAVNTGLANQQIQSIAVYYGTTLLCCTRASGGGGVYTSDDNGTTWQSTTLTNINASASCYAYGYVFVGVPTGIAMRQGSTWSTVPSSSAVINSVAAGANGVAVASAKGIALFNTTNSGTSWANPKTFGDTSVLTTFIASNGTCYCGLNGAGVYSSTDNGATWTTTGLPYYSIFSISQGHGAIYCGSNSRGILKMASGSNSWVVIDTEFVSKASVTALCVDSSGTIWAGSDQGAIICSTDDGATWTKKNIVNGAYVNALTSSPTGTTFAATAQGLFSTTDAGTTWTALTISVIAPYHALVSNSSGQVFVATQSNGVFESTDDGKTWAATNTGLKPIEILSLSMDAGGYLMAGTIGGGVYRTTATTVGGSVTISPAAPVIVSAIPGSDSATLVWNADHKSHIVVYLVYGGLSPAPTTLVDTVTDTTAILTNLTNDTTYYFRIKAYDDRGITSPFSNEVSVTPVISAAGEYKGDSKTSALFHGDRHGSDASGHGNNATLHGVTIGNGRFGSAWVFNGTGGYAAIPNTAALNPSSQLTVELWCKISPGSANRVLLGKRTAPGAGQQYGLGFLDTTFSAWINCNGVDVMIYGRTVIQPNEWYHVAEVYNGSKLVLYVNGIEDASAAATGRILSGTDSVMIGLPATLRDSALGCTIDEIRISSTARAASSLQLYLPTAVTQAATVDLEPNIKLHGVANPRGLPTKIYFEWDTTAAMTNPTQTALQNIGGGNTDTNVSALITAVSPHKYYFRLVAVTTVGLTKGATQSYATVVGVNEEAINPQSSMLEKNYPNPFVISTTFSVNLSPSETEHSTLKVFDVFGREVADLTGAMREHPERVELTSENLAAGMYWCVLVTPSSRTSRPMIVAK